ncbi:MAG: hypothetical protein ACI8RD_004622 [Bacillariaceae sp.]|jgi:hypothetical protein
MHLANWTDFWGIMMKRTNYARPDIYKTLTVRKYKQITLRTTTTNMHNEQIKRYSVKLILKDLNKLNFIFRIMKIYPYYYYYSIAPMK